MQPSRLLPAEPPPLRFRDGILGAVVDWLQRDPEPDFQDVRVLARSVVDALVRMLRALSERELSEGEVADAVLRELRLCGYRKGGSVGAALSASGDREHVYYPSAVQERDLCVSTETLMKALLLPPRGRDTPEYVILGARFFRESGGLWIQPDDVTRLLNRADLLSARGGKEIDDVSLVMARLERKKFFARKAIPRSPGTTKKYFHYQFTQLGLTDSENTLRARLACAHIQVS